MDRSLLRHIYEDVEGKKYLPPHLHIFYKHYYIELYEYYDDKDNTVLIEFNGNVYGWMHKYFIYVPFIYKGRPYKVFRTEDYIK